MQEWRSSRAARHYKTSVTKLRRSQLSTRRFGLTGRSGERLTGSIEIDRAVPRSIGARKANQVLFFPPIAFELRSRRFGLLRVPVGQAGVENFDTTKARSCSRGSGATLFLSRLFETRPRTHRTRGDGSSAK